MTNYKISPIQPKPRSLERTPVPIYKYVDFSQKLLLNQLINELTKTFQDQQKRMEKAQEKIRESFEEK